MKMSRRARSRWGRARWLPRRTTRALNACKTSVSHCDFTPARPLSRALYSLQSLPLHILQLIRQGSSAQTRHRHGRQRHSTRRLNIKSATRARRATKMPVRMTQSSQKLSMLKPNFCRIMSVANETLVPAKESLSCTPARSLTTRASKAYLKMDRYGIHPTAGGMASACPLFVFLAQSSVAEGHASLA
jgi:hypothetical protein